MTMSNPEEIGFQLDNLLTEVEETSQLIDDLDQDILPEYTTEWENEMDFDSILDELSTEVETEIKPAKKVKE
jgi:vacuolar-type H+-ATPase subunit D/Vma8